MEQRAAKRVLDIIVSGLGIIVSSPIMLIIAIAVVKAYDGGPVFYLQDRLTYQGKDVPRSSGIHMLREISGCGTTFPDRARRSGDKMPDRRRKRYTAMAAIFAASKRQ